MKLAMSAFAVLAALGALPYLMAESETTGTAIENAKTQNRYHLSVSGREGYCTVVKRGGDKAQRAELQLTPECVAMMPRLADARYWQESGAGEVSFVAADGSSVVEFFAADGVAYESLKPISPIVALKAQ
ncbi:MULTISPECIES: hypothetical protein [Chelativorans]|jgi:hypothetical protein|uniref:Alkaline proteinase inhibitor/ Outer membrane lipoprotein Omp19 domain-containing protein n=1 Tax=Chelativorans sp. (strain BNC1) TaxID=266779 RepID=Q11EI2_CHESB|nr:MULTISPECIES: hypothetical protein [Chelativorans]